MPILKNDGVKVNGKDDIPHMKWNIKVMFETTNQLYVRGEGYILPMLVKSHN